MSSKITGEKTVLAEIQGSGFLFAKNSKFAL